MDIKRVTWSKFHSEEPQILGATSLAIWSPGFVHPWSNLLGSGIIKFIKWGLGGSRSLWIFNENRRLLRISKVNYCAPKRQLLDFISTKPTINLWLLYRTLYQAGKVRSRPTGQAVNFNYGIPILMLLYWLWGGRGMGFCCNQTVPGFLVTRKRLVLPDCKELCYSSGIGPT
jgi:hypothetical protein